MLVVSAVYNSEKKKKNSMKNRMAEQTELFFFQKG